MEGFPGDGIPAERAQFHLFFQVIPQLIGVRSGLFHSQAIHQHFKRLALLTTPHSGLPRSHRGCGRAHDPWPRWIGRGGRAGRPVPRVPGSRGSTPGIEDDKDQPHDLPGGSGGGLHGCQQPGSPHPGGGFGSGGTGGQHVSLLERLHSGQSPRMQAALASAAIRCAQPDIALKVARQVQPLRQPELWVIAIERLISAHSALGAMPQEASELLVALIKVC